MENKYYHKIGCKSSRLEPQIIELLNQGVLKKEIARRFKICRETVIKVAHKHGLQVDERAISAKKKIKTKMNEQVIDMVLQGHKYETISKKFKVTRQRIQQIAHSYNMSSRTEKKKTDAQITELVKQDLKQGATSQDVLKKYGTSLPANCLVILAQKKRAETQERNKNIVREFQEGKKAKELAEKYNLKSLNEVYRICVQHNIRRYPQIQNRNHGELSEKNIIFRLVVRLKEEGDLTFKEIADVFNKSKYKTISNRKFTEANTRAKYFMAKRKNVA